MPDRVTNTMKVGSDEHEYLFRPTVINCYSGDWNDTASWWNQWKAFFFANNVQLARARQMGTATIASLLKPISRAKYPALTEKEEAVSIPLQLLTLAIFDAALLHIVESVAPSWWQALRTGMCAALNNQKLPRIAEVLSTTYAHADTILLQEVAAAFVHDLSVHPHFSEAYHLVQPHGAKTGRDQLSVVLLSKSRFGQVKDITVEVEDAMRAAQSGASDSSGQQHGSNELPISPGDLLVVEAQSATRPYIFASFHGDTDGLATLPTLDAVASVWRSSGNSAAAHIVANGGAAAAAPYLIFGLDANTYEHAGDQSPQKKKKQAVTGFSSAFRSHGLSSCWGSNPDPTSYTTYNARTFLQPQLNKAIRQGETKLKGDINPKDFILFSNAEFEQVGAASKDNTGTQHYVENMLFPTLHFPSDHAAVAVTLQPRA
eukprot:SAG31_NODE_3262_length_4482_cov_8.132101_3_plen_431_part_00